MYKYLILPFGLLTLSAQAMERKLFKVTESECEETAIFNYNEARDGQETRELFKKNWDHIYYGKSYSEELVRALLDTQSDPASEHASLKEIKALRNSKKLLGLVSFYRFYKRPATSPDKQGWLEVLTVDQTLPKKDIQVNENFLMYVALERLHEIGTPSTQMWVLKEHTSEIAQAEKFGFQRVGETPTKKGWRYLYTHTPEQTKKLNELIIKALQ